MPERLDGWPVRVTSDLDDVLPDVDVIYLLRIQRERIGQALFPTLREYSARWGLSVERAARCKPDTLVMHPGPDEPRDRDRGRGRRLVAFAGDRTGRERCRGAHGRAVVAPRIRRPDCLTSC